jgi:hypothetical protein
MGIEDFHDPWIEGIIDPLDPRFYISRNISHTETYSRCVYYIFTNSHLAIHFYCLYTIGTLLPTLVLYPHPTAGYTLRYVPIGHQYLDSLARDVTALLRSICMHRHYRHGILVRRRGCLCHSDTTSTIFRHRKPSPKAMVRTF